MVRNLSIPSKVIALLAVPVTGVLLLGVAAVAGGFGERARAGEEVRVAAVAGHAELAARRRRADWALAAYRAAAAGLGRTGDPGLDQALAEAGARLDRLPVVRAETDRHLVPPELAGGGHGALVDALLAVTRGLAAHLDAPGPSRTARLLLAVATAKEATGQERTLLATVPVGERPRSRRPTRRCCGSGWARSTGGSTGPGCGRYGGWSWPCSTRWPAPRPPVTWRRGGTGWQRGPGRCGGWSVRWPTVSSSCWTGWPGTSPTPSATGTCSASTTWPAGCAAPPRPCSPWPAPGRCGRGPDPCPSTPCSAPPSPRPSPAGPARAGPGAGSTC